MNDQFRRVTLTAFHANDTLKTITLHKGDDRGRIIRLVLRYCAQEEVLGVRFVLTQGEGQNTETLYQDMEPVPGEQYATFEFEAATGNVEIGLYPCAFKVSMVENHIVNTLTSKVNVVPDIAMPLDAEEMDSITDMVTRGYDVTNHMMRALVNIDITLENDGILSVTDEDGVPNTFEGLKDATEQAQRINAVMDEETGIVTVTDKNAHEYVYTGLQNAVRDANSAANQANQSAESADHAATQAINASNTANGAANSATRAANSANTAADNANTAASTVSAAANRADVAANRANAAAAACNTWYIANDELHLGVTAYVDVENQAIVIRGAA